MQQCVTLLLTPKRASVGACGLSQSQSSSSLPCLSLPPRRDLWVVGCSFSRVPPSASCSFPVLFSVLPPCSARATADPSVAAPPWRPDPELRSTPSRPPTPPARPGAGSLPLHPGTDSSRLDFGTMVMAEGTAVLRRNRPGTKAQVPSLHLFCVGTLGGEPRRTWKLAAPERRLGRGGKLAGRGHPCPACSSGAATPGSSWGGGRSRGLRSPDLRVGLRGWVRASGGDRRDPGVRARRQRLLALVSPLNSDYRPRGAAGQVDTLGFWEGRCRHGGRGCKQPTLFWLPVPTWLVTRLPGFCLPACLAGSWWRLSSCGLPLTISRCSFSLAQQISSGCSC